MPRKSVIDGLPDQVKSRLNFMIKEGALTIDQLTDWLDEQGHTVGRSSVGRHAAKIAKMRERMRQSREVTEALTRDLGTAAIEGQQGRLLIEITRNLIFDVLSNVDEGEELDGDGNPVPAFGPKEIMMLGKGLKELAQAARLDQDFETKVIEQVRQKAREEAAKVAETEVTEMGLTEEQAGIIRAKIMGIKVQAAEAATDGGQ
ncbi:MAG: DUF3486 family protein [Magnetovibrionaceae bacterium]